MRTTTRKHKIHNIERSNIKWSIEIMNALGLKDRKNFLKYSLTPALTEGLAIMKYPDSPRHPRQKYLLTVKGRAFYDECCKN